MKTLLLATLFFSTLAHANTYEILGCQLTKNSDGLTWGTGAAISGKRDLAENESESMGSGRVSNTVAFCNLLQGQNSTALKVTLFAATASRNVAVDRNCHFSGDNLDVKNQEKVLHEREYIFIEFLAMPNFPMRNVMYFPSAADIAQPNWQTSLCNSIAREMH